MTSAPDNPGVSAKRVLMICSGTLADFMQALGGMEAVRNAHPSAQITLLTTPEFEAFSKACPYCDQTAIYGDPRDKTGGSSVIKRLRSEKFDIAYDFQQDTASKNFYTGIKPKLWSGVAIGCAFPVEPAAAAGLHRLEHISLQLTAAGIAEFNALYPSFDWIEPSLGNPPRLQAEYFGVKGAYGLIIPMPEIPESDNAFPTSRYIDLAGWMLENEITPIIIGGREESPIGNNIVRKDPRAKSLCTRTDLFQILTLSRSANFVVGYDTDNMHLASLSGAPGVALYDAQARNPDLYRPRGNNLVMLSANNLQDIELSDIIQAIKALGGLEAT